MTLTPEQIAVVRAALIDLRYETINDIGRLADPIDETLTAFELFGLKWAVSVEALMKDAWAGNEQFKPVEGTS